MKRNNGITMVALIITIILILILAGIPIGVGSKVIKQSELENLKTNMMLIKVNGRNRKNIQDFPLEGVSL